MQSKEQKKITLNLQQSELLEQSLMQNHSVELHAIKKTERNNIVSGRKVGTFAKRKKNYTFSFAQYFLRFVKGKINKQ